MRRRAPIGAALASVVVLIGAGCDSGSESASAPDELPAETIPSTPTTQTTDGAGTTTSGAIGTRTVTTPTDTGLTPDTATSTTTTPIEPRYALVPTRRCLVRAGLEVSRVGNSDARLQALGDLAQRTSLEVHSGADVVGLAITDVELLEGLLAVPNDPYRIETRGNALLMFKPAARDLSRRVRDCLRA